MSFYELDRPTATTALTDRIGSIFASLRATYKGVLHSFAYARMMRALYEMDDATLGRIGITREGIPAYVERCLAEDRSLKA